ncbi:hypothetical protein [Clostridium sp. ZBS15]|uniref:hypothetical protein n=1 Tax=Clostridium sp. ZBS15 TaxID=2949969 RepID=UPI0020795CDB|nr:hypothetical protein [Clostridium sp. ZBS15]
MININNKINDLKNYFKSNDNIFSAWFTGAYGTELEIMIRGYNKESQLLYL